MLLKHRFNDARQVSEACSERLRIDPSSFAGEPFPKFLNIMPRKWGIATLSSAEV